MKRRPELIVMLTRDDVTVKNACDVFMSSWDLDAPNWGFKNTGITGVEMKKLVKTMKTKEKRIFLEMVTYDEKSCLDSAKAGIECGVDEIMGGPYFISVQKILAENNIPYKPFAGKVSGSPSILEGSCGEIIDEAKRLMEKGIDGFDILAYRRKENGETLARQFCAAVNAKICIAGSISSFDRIDVMFDIAPWAFTIGSVLFGKTFMPGGSFRENLTAILDYINSKQGETHYHG